MKSLSIAAATVLFGLMTAAGLVAQQTTQRTSEPGKDELHVSGCVAALPEGGKWVLTNATAVGVASRTRAMPNGPASAAEPAERRTYELIGMDLQAHVGHQVEVAGILDDSRIRNRASAGTGTAGTPGTTATGGTPGVAGTTGTTAPEVLKVTSVKPVADSCS